MTLSPDHPDAPDDGPQVRLARAVGLDLEDRISPAPGCATGQCPIQRWVGRRLVTLDLAWHGLRAWGRRQWLAAAVATLAVGLVVGIATVLIPNPVFGRDIPPEPWSYPVWILTSVLTGMLIATYVRPADPERLGSVAATVADLYRLRGEGDAPARVGVATRDAQVPGEKGTDAQGADERTPTAAWADAATGEPAHAVTAEVVAGSTDGVTDGSDRRSARLGTAAGFLAWFAVGCPVCNKIALIALGYTGALTWFAPAQPYLAGLALALGAVAIVWRLKGQVACATPTRR